jgi:hypothetical protein
MGVNMSNKTAFTIFLFLLIIALSACSGGKAGYLQIELEDTITHIKIPSLNGNLISVCIYKPDTEGPYPALIGISGGDGSNIFQHMPFIKEGVLGMGLLAVDFAPQGRSVSEGEDNYHGYIHQEDLKAVIDFLYKQDFTDKNNIGIISFSYGIAIATGSLSRYPDMPVQFLIDFEGPACPGRDLRRAMENNEEWLSNPVLSNVLEGDVIHGGSIYDDEYWDERDASLFIRNIPCPYLRIQFQIDHVQGTSKYHMMDIINSASEYSGKWTRCNDNPANIIYKESKLGNYNFHTEIQHIVILEYIKEMFFERPWLK